MRAKLVMLPPQTDIYRAWASRLVSELPGLKVVVAEDTYAAKAAVRDADAIFGYLSREVLCETRNLKLLQAPQAAPPAGFYFAELVAHPAVVTNFREIFNDHIGAHIMAFVLAFARGLDRYLPQQSQSLWAKPAEDHGVVHLPDATMLIVGLGGIGAEAARLAAAFGMTVIATDVRRTDVPPGVSELHKADALDELLPRADFVVLTVPHTPATEGFFDRARFAHMKKTAFFINIGRGMTTRLDDLVATLREGGISGAALDVFEIEPLPQDHPLWTMPGVMITPHMAGYGPHLWERRYEILRDNCAALMTGGPFRNQVDKANWF